MNNTTYERERRRRLAEKRRARERRKKLFLTVLTLIFAITICLTIKGMKANATNEKHDDYKYFTVIKVQVGDTLTDIANQYYDEDHYATVEDYILEIKYSNNLLDGNLISGQNLVIPYYSPEYHS